MAQAPDWKLVDAGHAGGRVYLVTHLGDIEGVLIRHPGGDRWDAYRNSTEWGEFTSEAEALEFIKEIH